MPTFVDGGSTFELNRAAMLIDTNVLVAAFSPEEGRKHDDALGLIDNPDLYDVAQWLIPMFVIVEAWGMLTRNGNREGGYEMIRWLNDPGNPVAFCRYATEDEDRDPPISLQRVVQALNVDVVDTLILAMAEEMTRQCDLKPPVQLATFDYRDFPRLKRALGARVRIFDMNSMQLDEA